MKTYQQFIFEAYDRSTGRPHRGTDYLGRDYGGHPDDKPTVKISLSGVEQGGWSEKDKKKKTQKEEYIDETSLSRVVSKIKKGGIATISAERGDKSKSQNKARSKQLEKDIRGRGMGMTKSRGSFVEVDDEGKRREVGERSYVVTPGKKGKRKFKKAVAALGKKHDQDSVLIKQKPGLKSKASWLGTTKRKGAEPKQGKTSAQGTLSTSNSNKPLPAGEGGTKVKNRTYQFK